MQQFISRLLLIIRIVCIGLVIAVPVSLLIIISIKSLKQEFDELYWILIGLLMAILIIGYVVSYNYVIDKMLMTKQYLYAVATIFILFSVLPVLALVIQLISERFSETYGLLFLIFIAVLVAIVTRKKRIK